MFLVKFHRGLTRPISPKWWFSNGNPRQFQGNLGWWNIIIWPVPCFMALWKPLWGDYFVGASIVWGFVDPKHFRSIISSGYATSIWTLTSVVSLLRHLDILFFFYYSKDKKAYIIFWWPQRFSISCDDFPVSALQTFVASEKRRRALRRICSMWTLPMCMVWLPVGATPKF